MAGWLKSIGSAISDFAGPILKAMGQSDAATAVTSAGSSLGNAQVAAGLVPAARAAELVKDQIADLPLLAAIEAARTRGLTTEADRATKALADQRAARADLTTAERSAQFNTDMASGNDRLAQMREELRLVGATDMERVRALATLKATQEAQKYNPGDRAAYIEQQVAIAVGAQHVVEKQAELNAELRATSDLFDTIDQSAQRAAQGMADAFGNAGTAIGDALTVMTGYYTDQAKLQEAHKAAIDAAGNDQKKIERENRLFSLRSSSQQISAFGDMTAAAKGFFKEGSTGYQTLATAEKAFRLVQFAMSVRAIAQDAIETGSKIANSVARIAVGATEAVVNAIKSLPFPLNIAAGAATVTVRMIPPDLRLQKVRAKFNLDSMLRGDAATQWRNAVLARTAGILSVNTIGTQWFGQPKIEADWADDPRAPLNSNRAADTLTGGETSPQDKVE